jgi:hypothetical protein
MKQQRLLERSKHQLDPACMRCEVRPVYLLGGSKSRGWIFCPGCHCRRLGQELLYDVREGALSDWDLLGIHTSPVSRYNEIMNLSRYESSARETGRPSRMQGEQASALDLLCTQCSLIHHDKRILHKLVSATSPTIESWCCDRPKHARQLS